MAKNFKFYWEEPFDREEPAIKIRVPGFRKNEIKVELTTDFLRIRAEKKGRREEKKRGFYKEEVFSRSFEKTIALPHKINHESFKISVMDGAVTLEKKKHL